MYGHTLGHRLGFWCRGSYFEVVSLFGVPGIRTALNPKPLNPKRQAYNMGIKPTIPKGLSWVEKTVFKAARGDPFLRRKY